MNGVKDAFSNMPVYSEKEPVFPCDRILLRNSLHLSSYRVANLRVKKQNNGYAVLAEWMEMASQESFAPGSSIYFVLYVTEVGLAGIGVTNWAKVPQDLADPPLIELWFDPKEQAAMGTER